jgi:hypothetical protein
LILNCHTNLSLMIDEWQSSYISGSDSIALRSE